MGLNTDCVSQLDLEKKFITYRVVNMQNKKVGFEISNRGEKKVVTPEQCMAFYLRKVACFFEKAGLNPSQMVISVPTYASNAERQAYMDAAEIAGISCPRLINESTAIALTYGFYKRTDLTDNKPRIVAFVDMGHSKLNVTLASFLKGKTKILYTQSVRNLGARNFDLLLFDKFSG